MRVFILPATLAVCAFAAPGELRIDMWGTGEKGPLSYHRVTADCESFAHLHGRNAAWGHWRVPMPDLQLTVLPGETGAALRMTCRDGSDCIEAGALTNLPNRIGQHDIPFGDTARAEAMKRAVEELAKACAA